MSAERAFEFEFAEPADGPCQRCQSAPAVLGLRMGANVLSLCADCGIGLAKDVVTDGPAEALEQMLRDLQLSHSVIGGSA